MSIITVQQNKGVLSEYFKQYSINAGTKNFKIGLHSAPISGSIFNLGREAANATENSIENMNY